MRAGLLSNAEVIERLNKEFVSTWILIDDVKRLANQGDRFAQTLATHWEFPLDLMFLTPDGRFVSKLNSFKHFKSAHPDVGHPPEGRGRAAPHIDVFMKHVDEHFGRK